MELAKNNAQLTELLNDLIKINYDRIEAYDKAQELMIDNKDLKSVFRERTRQGLNFISDLKEIVSKPTGESNGTVVPGLILRTWMNLKNTFTSNKNSSILDSCEFIEDSAVKAYDGALRSDAEIPAEIRQKIIEEQNEIKKSHDFIKKFRDFNLDLTA